MTRKNLLSVSRLLALALATASIFGQQATTPVVGFPTDWTHRHVIFSPPATPEAAARVQQDPRYWLQVLQRAPRSVSPSVTDAISMDPFNQSKNSKKNKDLKTDWSEDMGSGTKVGQDNDPAKYSFSTGDPATANCAGGAAPDFVVYNTGAAGGSGQASIIAYDNLYSGLCSGTVPQTYWAYNTGGTIETSVVLSYDGSQVAFIHSASPASLVLLKWKASTGSFTGTTHGNTSVTVSSCTSLSTGSPIYGTGIPQGDTIAGCSSPTLTLAIAATNSASETLTYSNATATSPASPTSVANSAYRTCTAPCMTTIAFNGGSTDTISSPFYDYLHDIIWVGDAGANLHKFAGVFNGSFPGEAIASHTGTGGTLTSGSPTVTITSGTFSDADIGATITDSKGGIPSSTTIIAVTSATTATMSKNASANESSDTITITTPWPVHFANTNATSPVYDSGSGSVYLADFISNLTKVNASTGATTAVSLPGSGNDIAEGPIVDSSEQMVYVFVDGCSSTCSGGQVGNYVAQIPTSLSTAREVIVGAGGGGTRQLYTGTFDNAYYSTGTGNLYVCGNTDGSNGPILYQIPIAAGVMGTTVNTGPTLTTSSSTGTTCSPLSEVYNNVLVATPKGPFDWIYLGVTNHGSPSACSGGGCVMGVTVTSWQKGTAYSLGQMVVDSHFNIEVVTAAGTSGASITWPGSTPAGTTKTDGGVTWTSQGPFTFTAFQNGHSYTTNTVIVDSNNNLQRVTSGTGTSQSTGTPGWSTSFGVTTTSGTVTFTNQGPSGIVASAYTGGTSGIVIDNISLASGASNIYFSTLSNMTCATSGGSGGCAVQASQILP